MAEVFLGSSPHIGTPVRTPLLMGHVLIALTPVSIWGVAIYGFKALLVILVSVVSAAAGEALFRRIIGRENRSGDLSAPLTGLLLALVLPPSTPLWMAALGAVFAVVAAKEFFGGLGANVFNPALSGRAFLLMSFPAAITTWTLPGGVLSGLSGASVADAGPDAGLEALTGATPLGIIKMGGAVADVGREFTAFGLAPSPAYWQTIKTLFVGNHGGTIGETSVLLILAGCLYLLIARVIDWRAPVTMIASAFGLSLILYLVEPAAAPDPLFAVLSGGLLFGAVFMATDYTTAPLTARGKLLFGAGAGIITVLIRRWGNYPEGTSYGILIMNAVTPFLNRLLQRKYGHGPSKKGAA
ncbi:MAG: RnfABCDGE type electron transport complex subunit D [Treponema sp.]|jgi:electron transport complex protein RnfD|nr:RnfABCDGE type electron transport complex subunit D [Treponema sp.]